MRKAIVIEDDADIAELIRKRLQKASYQVAILPDGWGAVEYIAHNEGQPDVIILDLRLPAYSGVELLGMLKNTFPRTKIFIYSAHVTAVQIPVQMGISGIFCKTDGLDNLLNSIEDAFDSEEKRG